MMNLVTGLVSSSRRNSVDLEWEMASAWQQKGRLDRAIAGYEKVLAVQPNHTSALLALSLLMLEREQLPQAWTLFQQAAESTPNSDELQYSLIQAISKSNPQNPAKRWINEWNKPISQPISGYTALLPVPGDLPVFTQIALDVFSRQNPQHLVEILVVPDQLTPRFLELIKHWSQSFSTVPVRVVDPSFPAKLLLWNRNPHVNYWVQLVSGSNAVRTTHALLHDADLFITEPDFAKNHYESCAQKQLACLGASPVWDRWYQEHGLEHLVSTWEMMFSVEWLRSFQPLEHIGHEGVIAGKRHVFDVTLYPQCQTPPDRIDRHTQEWGFIHFNYVIGTYRFFLASKSPFEDEFFRILLIRLLIDACDSSDWNYEVPVLSELSQGLSEPANRVTYLQEKTRSHYKNFRLKLQQLINSGLLSTQKAANLSEAVRPFDQALSDSL